MRNEDADDFKATLSAVYGLYGKDLSREVLSIWWLSMRPFDFAAVKDALNRHAVNPDNGQFLPKPADVVRLIQGGTVDGALRAWTKVARGLREVGCYRTVCFDDPIINAVIHDMGGWVALGMVTEDEIAFKAKEFGDRYRGYLTRGHVESYPAKLIGRADQANLQHGYAEDRVVFIGDKQLAQVVHRQVALLESAA